MLVKRIIHKSDVRNSRIFCIRLKKMRKITLPNLKIKKYTIKLRHIKSFIGHLVSGTYFSNKLPGFGGGGGSRLIF